MAYIGVSPSNGIRQKHTYTATANQTSFSGVGSENITLSYKDSNYVDVYQNGVKLGDADYTATSGTAIVLTQGASVNDIVEIVVYDVFSVADTVSKSDGGQFDGAVSFAGNITDSGDLTIDVAGDLILDADGGEIIIKDGGTENNRFIIGGNDAILKSSVSDGDMIFKGNDGGSEISALTLDMSEAGAATFNNKVVATELDISGDVDVDGTTNLDDTDIDGTLNVQGEVTLQTHLNMGDSDQIKLGADADMLIYHDGSHSSVQDNGTGDLRLKTNSAVVLLKGDSEVLAQFDADGGCTFKHDNTTRLATSGTGATVTGVIVSDGVDVGDNEKIRLGDSQDLEIYHDGSNSYVNDTGTGSLIIEGANVQIQDTQQDLLAKFNNAGAVQLYHVDSGTSVVKLATSGSGLTFTGDVAGSSSGAVNYELRSDSAGIQFGTTSNHYTAFRTNNTERARLDTTGRFAVPQQSHAIVEKTSTTSVGSSAVVFVVFDEERVDTGDVYNTSDGKFTAPIAGRYLLSAELQANGQYNQLHVGFYLNGGGSIGSLDPWVNFGDSSRAGTRTLAINLAAGDFLQVAAHFGSNSATLEANRQRASFYLLG